MWRTGRLDRNRVLERGKSPCKVSVVAGAWQGHKDCWWCRHIPLMEKRYKETEGKSTVKRGRCRKWLWERKLMRAERGSLLPSVSSVTLPRLFLPRLLYHQSCCSDFHNRAIWFTYHYFYCYHSDPSCHSLSCTSLLLLPKWCPCFYLLVYYLFSTQ